MDDLEMDRFIIFLFPSQQISPVLFPFLMPWLQISLTGSIWSVVSVASERFISIVYPSTR